MHTSEDQSRRMEVHRLMSEAAAAYGRGDHVLAARLCARVLLLQPAFPDALHLAGVCALAAGHPQQARMLLEQAATLKPGDPQLAYHLGIVRVDCGDRRAARKAFARAAALDPGNAEALFNLAVTSVEEGELEQAEAAYRRTLELTPHNAAAAAGLAAICEQHGALDEAERWCEVALRLDTANPIAQLTLAQLHFRAGEHAAAAAILEPLQAMDLGPRNGALVAGRLGMSYDRMDRPAEAWQMFLAAKQMLQATLPAEEFDVCSPKVAGRVARHLDALLGGVPAAPGAETPVFLVGFPRSGTTLLDQILSGHPGITVLEEKYTLEDLLPRYVLDDAGVQAFIAAAPETLAQDRARYWHRVEQYLPQRQREKLFVDKVPLNTLYLPLLARLFPAAKFVFALRDPRDVVLSCFMQIFALNQAMRHFLTLEESAALYAAVMDVGRRSRDALPERMHTVRYEDVVADTEREARALLGFLGLDWDPRVLDVQATAKRRRINTPTYHQVARPIYGDAQQRWRRYATQLEPVMSKLEPFVSAFGYS